MNYNVKRLTQPLKGICSCNYAAVKSIANLSNNNADYRQYNKAFFMRQLGDIMDRIEHGEECKLIEPVIPPMLTEAKLIGELKPAEGESIIKIINTSVVGTGGFLLVLNKEGGELDTIHYIFDGDNATTLGREDNAQLYAMYTPQLSDAFVQKLKNIANGKGITMAGSQFECSYDASCYYHLYGFT